MATFEELGRKIDRELERVRRYVRKEVKPATQRKAAQALHKAAELLAEAAKEMEARVARMKK